MKSMKKNTKKRREEENNSHRRCVFDKKNIKSPSFGSAGTS